MIKMSDFFGSPERPGAPGKPAPSPGRLVKALDAPDAKAPRNH